MSASIVIREKNVRIRIARTSRQSPVYWEFRWRDGAGRPRRLKRASRKEAVIEARRIAKALAKGRATQLSCSDVASFTAGIKNLADCGVTIESATAKFAEISRRLAGHGTIDEAVDFYLRHQGAAQSRKAVAEIVDEMIAARTAAGVGQRHLDDLTSRLGRLKREVQCPIGDLTAPIMDRWLQGISCAPRTRANYRAALSNLVSYAVGRKYLPPNCAEMKYVAAPARQPDDVEIFTIQEIELILRHVRESVLVAVVLGAFAGLRTSEILRLNWSDIHWARGLISVPRETKTGPRLAMLFPNARRWLEPMARIGPMLQMTMAGLMSGFESAIDRANAELIRQDCEQRISWKHNALRHSFVSYWASFEHELWKIAERTGHSVQILKKNYQRPDIFPDTGHAWFNIGPEVRSGLAPVQDKIICPQFAPSEQAYAKTP